MGFFHARRRSSGLTAFAPVLADVTYGRAILAYYGKLSVVFADF